MAQSVFREQFWGLHGFEELKKYMRQGSDFCKDVAFIVQERAELESTYAKGLSKVSARLIKATQNGIGTLADGWKAVASSIELEADLHKNLATSLMEDISKPLKHLLETQTKARKPIEVTVDKALKTLTDKRAEEYRAKKSCYESAKAHEKMEEQMATGKAKQATEKDASKTEKKQKMLLEALRKADKVYCEQCEKAEEARQEWDFSVNKASSQLQTLDEERITKMSDYLSQYSSNVSVMGPKLTQSCETLHGRVAAVDVNADVTKVAKERGSGQNTPEQILIDSYAEDKQFSMKPARKMLALQHYLLQLKTSLERQKKGREGVERLVSVYKERPTFADKDAQDDVMQRLTQVTFMMNFLEANHYKVAASLAELDHQQKPSHKFAKYIEHTRDKQNMQVSTLRLPLNLALEGNTGYDVMNVTIGAIRDDAQFDDSDDEFDTRYDQPPIGRCQVLYDYSSEATDELSISSGDVITLYKKIDQDWWEGELRGKTGLFPATYVQEIEHL